MPDLTKNRVEIMASCGYEALSLLPSLHSFCSVLVEELRSRMESDLNNTFNTAQLYRGIYHRLLNINRDLSGKQPEEPNKPTSPIHISLDERVERASFPLKVIRRNVRRNPRDPKPLPDRYCLAHDISREA
jgi:hypothetical protein